MRFGWLGTLVEMFSKGAEDEQIARELPPPADPVGPAKFDDLLDTREKADGEIGPDA